ncbi:MAG: hypothetical protein QXL94_03610 [Candidatus Parvarchaeum sp.]
MKTSTIIIAIIGIAVIGYVVYKYVYLPSKTSSTTSTPSITTTSTIPSTVSVSQYVAPSTTSTTTKSTSTTSTYTAPTSTTQNYYTPPSSGVYTAPKTSQISYAQQIACQRYPQLCAKEAPGLFSGSGPVTAYSPTQTSSSVHQSNPSTVSTGIGKYVRPMGGKAFNSW